MDKESTREKLLEACGVAAKNHSQSGQDQAMGRRPEQLLLQAEAAAASAQKAQAEAGKICAEFDLFMRNQLPLKLGKVVEQVAREEIRRSLESLHESVRQAESRIEFCSQGLTGITWNWRLLGYSFMVGLTTVLIGGCMVRCAFFEDKMVEAKRYEVFGRKVEEVIERYDPKDREKLYKWAGGRP